MKSYEFVLALDTIAELDKSLDKLMDIDGIITASLRAPSAADGGYPKVMLTASRDIKDELLAWYYVEPTKEEIAEFEEVHVIA